MIMNLTKVFQGDPPQINLRNMSICQSLVSQPSPVLPNQPKVFQENSGAFNLAFLSTRCLFHPPISYSGPVLPVDDLLNKATILCSWTYTKSSKEFLPRPEVSILPQGDMSVVHSLDSHTSTRLFSVDLQQSSLSWS